MLNLDMVCKGCMIGPDALDPLGLPSLGDFVGRAQYRVGLEIQRINSSLGTDTIGQEKCIESISCRRIDRDR